MDSRLRGNDGGGTHVAMQGWIPACAGMTEHRGNDGGAACSTLSCDRHRPGQGVPAHRAAKVLGDEPDRDHRPSTKDGGWDC